MKGASSLPDTVQVQASCVLSTDATEKGGFLLPSRVESPGSLLSLPWHHPGVGGPSLQPGESRSLSSSLDIYFQRYGWDDSFGEGSLWLMYFIRVLQRNWPIECVRVYMYLYVCICLYLWERERERKRERERRGERDWDWFNLICVKGLTYMIEGSGKSEMCRIGWQSEDPGKNWCCSWSPKAVWMQNFLFLGDLTLFLLRSSTD